MASITATASAKEIIVAWLGTTPLNGTKDHIAEHITYVLEKVADKLDELTAVGLKRRGVAE
jgi:hypothetical protein